MKRFGNIYPKIYDYENLYQAYRSARKEKTERGEVMAFTAHLEENLIEIQNQLMWHTYKPGRYREFYVSDPKKRLIMALPFRDRVVQWAIYRQLNPLLDKRYIPTSYACRIDGGTQRAVRKLQQYIRHTPGRVYVLKLDMAKYFYRVDHEVLLRILRRVIKDKELLEVLELIIRGTEEAPAFGIDIQTGARLRNVGMPIGNLTSQMFANLYLNEADQFAKHVLHARRYIRYMDDIVIISNDKAQLREQWRHMDEFLRQSLRLELNRKSTIQQAKRGVDFCGYVVYSDHIRMRRKAVIKIWRRLRYLQKMFRAGMLRVEQATMSLTSYLGLLKHCDADGLTRAITSSLVLSRSRRK